MASTHGFSLPPEVGGHQQRWIWDNPTSSQPIVRPRHSSEDSAIERTSQIISIGSNSSATVGITPDASILDDTAYHAIDVTSRSLNDGASTANFPLMADLPSPNWQTGSTWDVQYGALNRNIGLDIPLIQSISNYSEVNNYSTDLIVNLNAELQQYDGSNWAQNDLNFQGSSPFIEQRNNGALDGLADFEQWPIPANDTEEPQQFSLMGFNNFEPHAMTSHPLYESNTALFGDQIHHHPPWSHFNIPQGVPMDFAIPNTGPMSNNTIGSHHFGHNQQPQGTVTSTNPEIGSEEGSVTNTFVNVVAADGKMKELGPTTSTVPPRPATGKRKGNLPEGVRKGAAETRRKGACWACSHNKQRCIGGTKNTPCDRCRRGYEDKSLTVFCDRSKFGEHLDLFFPDPRARHHTWVKIKEFFKNCRWTDNQFTIRCTFKEGFPSIPVRVNEFETCIPTCANIAYIVTDDSGQSQKLVVHQGPLLGIRDVKLDDLEAMCDKYIDMIVADDVEINPASGYFAPMKEIFESIRGYYKRFEARKKPVLLTRILKLHALFFAMGELIILTSTSVRKAIRNLRATFPDADAKEICATLVNSQLKLCIYPLLRKEAKRVLDMLQREYRPKPRDQKMGSSWAIAFCSAMLLLICIEAVQIGTEGVLSNNIAWKAIGVDQMKKDRDATIYNSKSLDEILSMKIIYEFHDFFRTKKLPGPGYHQGKFNPIGDKDFDRERMGSSELQLIDEIKRIIRSYPKMIHDRAEAPSYISRNVEPNQMMERYYKFENETPGRLLSRFLLIFKEND